MGWLHTWCGLVTGWLLCAIFLTGTLSVFREPITRWMQAPPPVPAGARPMADGAAAQAALDWLAGAAPGARFWRIELPARQGEALRLAWRGRDGAQQRAFDPASGAVLPPQWVRDTEGGRHFMSFHYSLQAGLTGFWIVGVAAMGMLVALVSGVIVHKRIFSDFFTFRPGKGQRSWLDAHNAAGVLALPFLFMITLTGLWIFHTSYMPAPMHAAFGAGEAAYERLATALGGEPEAPRRKATGEAAPLPRMAPLLARAERLIGGDAELLLVERPGDSSMVVRVVGRRPDDGDSPRILNQPGTVILDGVNGAVLAVRKADPVEESAGSATHRVVEHLHYARFGGWTMRWLYFVSGLMGTALMATGTVLYLVKRRQKSLAEFGRATPLVYRCFEAINIAAISGCAVACIAYFYGNRLLPPDLATRPAWEIRVFLLAWLATLAHAALRPRTAAWVEQLALGALLCAGLPVLNYLTTGQHLAAYLARADWQSAGVELTSVCFAALLAFAAHKAAGKGRKP